MTMRTSCVLWALCIVSVTFGSRGAWGIGATATITSTQLGSNSYEYSLTLNNTGTTPIGTFWYAWIPGYNLLPSAPTQISSPSGWSANTNPPEPYGVASGQWVNTATPLQPGHSLSGFKFDSTDAPAAIFGNSSYGIPVGYSYVYIGAPETDPGALVIPTVVTPEPGTLGIMLVGVAFAASRRRRRRQQTA
jgi:PEP-CTERM motif